MTQQFDGRISIVTGAGSGIGFATAEGLAAGGATGHLRRPGRAPKRPPQRSARSGGNATGVMLDVRDSAGLDGADRGCGRAPWPDRYPRQQCRDSGAGRHRGDVSEEVWERILDINAKGVWLACGPSARHGRAQARQDLQTSPRPRPTSVCGRRRGYCRIEGGGARAHAPSRRAICAVQYPDQFGVARHGQ